MFFEAFVALIRTHLTKDFFKNNLGESTQVPISRNQLKGCLIFTILNLR